MIRKFDGFILFLFMFVFIHVYYLVLYKTHRYGYVNVYYIHFSMENHIKLYL